LPEARFEVGLRDGRPVDRRAADGTKHGGGGAAGEFPEHGSPRSTVPDRLA
jgi:hypothetical protein